MNFNWSTYFEDCAREWQPPLLGWHTAFINALKAGVGDSSDHILVYGEWCTARNLDSKWISDCLKLNKTCNIEAEVIVNKFVEYVNNRVFGKPFSAILDCDFWCLLWIYRRKTPLWKKYNQSRVPVRNKVHPCEFVFHRNHSLSLMISGRQTYESELLSARLPMMDYLLAN